MKYRSELSNIKSVMKKLTEQKIKDESYVEGVDNNEGRLGFIHGANYVLNLIDNEINIETVDMEDEKNHIGWDKQRSTMYEAWKRKEDEKQSKCEHRWCFGKPITCLNCGMLKEKYLKK